MKPTLYILCGPSGSGKSTWAHNFMIEEDRNGHDVRIVSRDEIRLSMLKDGDAYYVMLGLEENQTRVNLERTGRAEAIYAARPADDEQPQYAVSGARMELELVTDEELTQKLNTEGYDTSMFLKVTEAKPLG